MSNIDWSKAPEGTTHRNAADQMLDYSWRKVDGTSIHFWNAKNNRWEWLEDIDHTEQNRLVNYEARPIEPKPVAANPLHIPADIVPPPGATRVALVWYSSENGRAVVHQPNPEQGVVELVADLPTPEWDGTGRPPVGSVCMCEFTNGLRKVEIIGEHGKYVWVKQIDGNGGMSTFRYSEGRFTPYLTREQRAAKIRQDNIAEMCDEFGCMPGSPIGEKLAKLYDAGYRKGDEE